MAERTTLETNTNFVLGERSGKDSWVPVFRHGSNIGDPPLMFGNVNVDVESGREIVRLVMPDSEVSNYEVGDVNLESEESGARVVDYFDTDVAREQIKALGKKSIVAAGLFMAEALVSAFTCNRILWGGLPGSETVQEIISVVTLIGAPLIIYGTLVYLNENKNKQERFVRWIDRAGDLGNSVLADVELAKENWGNLKSNGTKGQDRFRSGQKKKPTSPEIVIHEIPGDQL